MSRPPRTRWNGPHKRRASKDADAMPPLLLTTAERVAVAHRLWAARRTMLLVAPMLPIHREPILEAAKAVTETVDLLLPEPHARGTTDDEE